MLLLFIFGAVIGSFLNVVIYRYPIMLEYSWKRACHEQLNLPIPNNKKPFNLCFPQSHCPQCKKKIPWYHNIPILSFLFLYGKCACCGGTLSKQYIFVELLSALLTLVIFQHFSFTLPAVYVLLLTYGLIVMSFIDLNHQFLPDSLTFSLLWLGLMVTTTPKDAIFAVVMGYLSLWLIAKLFYALRKKEGL